MRPMWCVAVRPTCCQVRPASRERYTPSPNETSMRMVVSPVPAYTTLGSEGATASAPMVALLRKPSETLRQYTPPSPVFQIPPAQAPK